MKYQIMAGNWRPIRNFEDEMFELQPDCDIIFEKYGKCADYEESNIPLSQLGLSVYGRDGHIPPINRNTSELEVVAQIYKMGYTPILGNLPCRKDINNMDNVEKETVHMMRSIGLEPSIDYPISSKTTIETRKTFKSHYFTTGRAMIPILLDEDFFKLRPIHTDHPDVEEEDSHFKTTEQLSSEVKSPSPQITQKKDCDIVRYNVKTNSLEPVNNYSRNSSMLCSLSDDKAFQSISSSSYDQDFPSLNGSSSFEKLIKKSPTTKKTIPKYYTPKELYTLKRSQ